MILGDVKNFRAGEAERRFERGRREAREKEEELLERLRALPEGEAKAEETKRRIDRVRAFSGYREYPLERSTAWSAATSSTGRRY
jgi:rifampicin phosphotransferase